MSTLENKNILSDCKFLNSMSKEKLTQLITPSLRNLYETINSLSLHNIGGMISVHEAKRLSGENVFKEFALKKCIINIQLTT